MIAEFSRSPGHDGILATHPYMVDLLFSGNVRGATEWAQETFDVRSPFSRSIERPDQDDLVSLWYEVGWRSVVWDGYLYLRDEADLVAFRLYAR